MRSRTLFLFLHSHRDVGHSSFNYSANLSKFPFHGPGLVAKGAKTELGELNQHGNEYNRMGQPGGDRSCHDLQVKPDGCKTEPSEREDTGNKTGKCESRPEGDREKAC